MPADPVSADRHRITDEPRPPQPVQPTQPPQPKQPAEPRRRRRLAWNLAVTILLLAAAGYVAWDLSAGFTRLPWAGRTLPWTDRQQSATEPGTGATADLAEHVPVNPAIAATDSGATATVENEIATGDHDQDGTANESSDRATEVTGNAEIAGENGYESALPVDRGGAEPADAADPPIETNLANASDPTNGADGELISQTSTSPRSRDRRGRTASATNSSRAVCRPSSGRPSSTTRSGTASMSVHIRPQPRPNRLSGGSRPIPASSTP